MYMPVHSILPNKPIGLQLSFSNFISTFLEPLHLVEPSVHSRIQILFVFIFMILISSFPGMLLVIITNSSSSSSSSSSSMQLYGNVCGCGPKAHTTDAND